MYLLGERSKETITTLYIHPAKLNFLSLLLIFPVRTRLFDFTLVNAWEFYSGSLQTILLVKGRASAEKEFLYDYHLLSVLVLLL